MGVVSITAMLMVLTHSFEGVISGSFGASMDVIAIREASNGIHSDVLIFYVTVSIRVV